MKTELFELIRNVKDSDEELNTLKSWIESDPTLKLKRAETIWEEYFEEEPRGLIGANFVTDTDGQLVSKILYDFFNSEESKLDETWSIVISDALLSGYKYFCKSPYGYIQNNIGFGFQVILSNMILTKDIKYISGIDFLNKAVMKRNELKDYLATIIPNLR